MAGIKRRILGIAFISVGVCAALPFRNEAIDAPLDPRVAVESPDAAPSHNELTLQLASPATSAVDPAPVTARHPISAVAETKLLPQPWEILRDQLAAPPSIASSFEPLVAALPAAEEEATVATRFDEPRRHRIADGDTLEALAERYFGNRDHWRTIFEANSELLTDRDILPIGKEIKIPDAPTPSSDGEDDHLVPIPPGLLNRE